MGGELQARVASLPPVLVPPLPPKELHAQIDPGHGAPDQVARGVEGAVQRIRRLDALYPGMWWLVATADIRCRSEHLDLLLLLHVL